MLEKMDFNMLSDKMESLQRMSIMATVSAQVSGNSGRYIDLNQSREEYIFLEKNGLKIHYFVVQTGKTLRGEHFASIEELTKRISEVTVKEFPEFESPSYTRLRQNIECNIKCLAKP